MPKSRNIEDYFPIGIEDLVPNETVSFDVHLYFEQNRHVMLWKSAGDLVPAAFLEKYVLRGIRRLWVHRDDTESFQQYTHPEIRAAQGPAAEELPTPLEVARAISDVMTSEALPEEKKTEEVANLAQELLRLSVEPDTRRNQTDSNERIREAVSEILDDVLDGTRDAARAQIAEIWKLANIDPDFEHAVNVSTFAVIFAMAFGRIDADLLADLALAGLLHDIGLSQVPAELTVIPWKSFTPEQLAVYALHVDFGIGLLQEYGKEVPPRVREIISQHHEKFNGSGYPRRLHGFKVDDIAQLLAMADILDSFASGQWDGTRRTLRDTFDMLEQLESTSTFPEYFNPDVFAAVIGWIRSNRSLDARPDAVKLVKTQTRQILKDQAS